MTEAMGQADQDQVRVKDLPEEAEVVDHQEAEDLQADHQEVEDHQEAAGLQADHQEVEDRPVEADLPADRLTAENLMEKTPEKAADHQEAEE